MKKSVKKKDELVKIPPFDFKNSMPNKFSEQYKKGTTVSVTRQEKKHIIRLEPDVANYFPDSASVNRVLRAIISSLPKKRQKAEKT